MRRVLIQACLVATAAVQLSACCCNSPTPDRPPPPPPASYPPPPPQYSPQPVPPPQPYPQPYQQPPPQPYSQPPQPYSNPPPPQQPPQGYHQAAPIPNGGYTQPPPPQNNYPPAQQGHAQQGHAQGHAQGAGDEAMAGSEAVAWAGQHGMTGARVVRVRWESNVWKVMLRGTTGNAEHRMHVYVLPNHGGVRSGVALGRPHGPGLGRRRAALTWAPSPRPRRRYPRPGRPLQRGCWSPTGCAASPCSRPAWASAFASPSGWSKR